MELIAKADVVIESLRPGVMQKLGIDFQAVRLARPELITLSIPGFASNDELRSDWKATEAVVVALGSPKRKDVACSILPLARFKASIT